MAKLFAMAASPACEPNLHLLTHEHLAEDVHRPLLLSVELTAEGLQCRGNGAVREVDAYLAAGIGGEDRDVVRRDVGLIVGLLAASVVGEASVEDRQDLRVVPEDRVVGRGATGELALASLQRLVHAEQRQDVGRVVMHCQLGSRLGPSSRLTPVSE